MRESISGARRSAFALIACIAPLALVTPAGAQTAPTPDGTAVSDTVPDFPPGVDEIDRVVAIVGDTAILRSELEITLFQLQSQGAQVPPEGTPDWTRLVHQVLEAQIDNLIVLQEARRAGLTADPGRVDDQAERTYQERRKNFTSDEEMAQAIEEAGMNMLQFRQLLRQQAEQQELMGAFQRSLQFRTDLPPVVINEAEIQAFFDEQARDQTRPALVSYNRLFVTPNPSGAARDSGLARIVAVRNELDAGESFEVVARRHSDDPGTRERGGELGWLKRTDVVKPFGDAVWASRAGQTIGPVQTRFGLHIIKIERARGAERFLRHILIRPDLEESDREEAQRIAGQIADSLRAGRDPESLARTFRGSVADEDIRVDNVVLDQLADGLPPEAASQLQAPVAGETYGPFPIEQGGPTEYAIFQIVEFRPAGAYELDDVRDQIRQSIRLQKQLEVILAEIRDRTFIDVKL